MIVSRSIKKLSPSIIACILFATVFNITTVEAMKHILMICLLLLAISTDVQGYVLGLTSYDNRV